MILEEIYDSLKTIRGNSEKGAWGFRCSGQVLFRPGASKLKGIPQNAIHTAAGKNVLLNHQFKVGALEAAASDGGVLTLDVFPHDDEFQSRKPHDVGVCDFCYN